MGERPKPDNAEREASIKATRERISDYWSELWDVHTSPEEKAEVYAGAKEARTRLLSWRGEVRKREREKFRRSRAEFRAVLCDEESGRLNPAGYLALKELQRSLVPTEEDAETARLFEEAADEFERLLGAVEQGEEAAIGGPFHMIDNIPEGFVFRADDIPYLREEAIYFTERANESGPRRGALEWVLNDYERRGILTDEKDRLMEYLFDGDSSAPHGKYALTGSEGRSLEYFGAVLELRGEAFENVTSYAKAIADRCPKEDGDTPSYQAVLDWLSREGHRKRGQRKLKDFRPRLEHLAGAVLRHRARAGDGAAGKPPHVSK